ncbi:SRPBCC family protein [Alsobacter sp. R-9]
MSVNTLSHSCTALVAAPARTVFDFLVDPVRLGQWSLGCMQVEPAGPAGIWTGRSLFDGGQGYFEIDADPARLLIDYRVGSLEVRQPRISARVVPGPVCGLGENQCYATLTAWRPPTMHEDRWARLCAAHEAEIWLIKEQIEARLETPRA